MHPDSTHTARAHALVGASPEATFFPSPPPAAVGYLEAAQSTAEFNGGGTAFDLAPSHDSGNAYALLVASAYVDTPAPTAESVLAAVERVVNLGSGDMAASERITTARGLIREWRAES